MGLLAACLCSKLGVTVAARCRPSQCLIESQQDMRSLAALRLIARTTNSDGDEWQASPIMRRFVYRL